MCTCASLDKSLSTDQVLEILIAFFVLLLFLNCLSYDIPQLSAIKERSSILQDVIWAIVQDLSDE